MAFLHSLSAQDPADAKDDTKSKKGLSSAKESVSKKRKAGTHKA